MNNLIFVSYYTKNTIYEKVINNYLLPSLKKFNLKYHIEAIENKGNFFLNVIQKPVIAYNALNKFSQNIVVIDADAIIEYYPTLLFEIPDRFDIGFHWLDWGYHYGKLHGKKELLDGTLYINNNEKMRNFIKQWVENSTIKKLNNQIALEKMILEKGLDIKVFELPREYCYITTQPYNKPPAIIIKHPIITHHQASRKAKYNLKGDK